MFSSTPGFPLALRPRPSFRRGAKAPHAPRPGSPGAAADTDPPVQRLTPRQIRAAGETWKARAPAGDESALRVAAALEWLAEHRASEEARPPRRSLAGRISAWMGLAESSRTRH